MSRRRESCSRPSSCWSPTTCRATGSRSCSSPRWAGSTRPRCARWPAPCAPRIPRSDPASWSAGRCWTRRCSTEWTGGLRPAPGRLAQLLERARADLAEGASAEQVLWTLWSGTPWGDRLRAASLGGGQAARLAHRDLDALCALFETAARSEEQRDHTSVATFLATLTAQEIPADTLAERGCAGRVGAAAHGPSGQGTGVAAGRRGPRPGGQLARPAPARLLAGRRPDRPRRPSRSAPATDAGRDARRGAATVLRRGDPAPTATRRDRGEVARRRRRAAFAVPGRARARRAAPGGAASASALDARTRRRPAPHGRRSRAAVLAARGRRRSTPAARDHRGARPLGGALRRPGDLVGAAQSVAIATAGAS